MKLHTLAVAFLAAGYSVLSQNSGVVISEDLNSTPDQSSILDVQSNTKGVLISRMSAAERDAIQSPAQGLLVFVNDDNEFYFWNETEWKKIGSRQFEEHASGNLFLTNKKLAIGNVSPYYDFQVASNTGSWGAYFNNNHTNGYGVLFDNKSTNTSRLSLKVRSWDGTYFQPNLVVTSGGSNAKVAIGAETPKERLHVRGNLRLDQHSAVGDPYIHLIPDGKEANSWMMGVDDSGNKLSFAYGLNSGATPFGTAADKMTLDNNGYLGLGTVSPNARLHVKGSNAVIMSENTDNGRVITINSGSSMIESTSNLNLNRYSTHHVTLVQGGGNVGIGVADPQADLDIKDDGRIRLEQTAGTSGFQWDINQAGADGLVLGKVGSTGFFKLHDDGKAEIKKNTISGASLTLSGTSPTSWNYTEYRSSATSRQAWIGTESQTGDFVIAKEGSGEIVIKGAKVKVQEVMNLPILETLPTTDTENGDVILYRSGSDISMKVYYSGTWRDL